MSPSTLLMLAGGMRMCAVLGAIHAVFAACSGDWLAGGASASFAVMNWFGGGILRRRSAAVANTMIDARMREIRSHLAVRPSAPVGPTGFPAAPPGVLPDGMHLIPTEGCACAACATSRVFTIEWLIATVAVAIQVRKGMRLFGVSTNEVVTKDGAAGVNVVVIDAGLYEREVRPVLLRHEEANRRG